MAAFRVLLAYRQEIRAGEEPSEAESELRIRSAKWIAMEWIERGWRP